MILQINGYLVRTILLYKVIFLFEQQNCIKNSEKRKWHMGNCISFNNKVETRNKLRETSNQWCKFQFFIYLETIRTWTSNLFWGGFMSILFLLKMVFVFPLKMNFIWYVNSRIKHHMQLFAAAGYQTILTSIAWKTEMTVFLNPDSNNKRVCPAIQILMHQTKNSLKIT